MLRADVDAHIQAQIISDRAGSLEPGVAFSSLHRLQLLSKEGPGEHLGQGSVGDIVGRAKQTAAIAGDPAIGRSLRDVAVCPVGLWDIVKYGGGGRQGRSRAAQESHNGYETGSQGSG